MRNIGREALQLIDVTLDSLQEHIDHECETAKFIGRIYYGKSLIEPLRGYVLRHSRHVFKRLQDLRGEAKTDKPGRLQSHRDCEQKNPDELFQPHDERVEIVSLSDEQLPVADIVHVTDHKNVRPIGHSIDPWRVIGSFPCERYASEGARAQSLIAT